jgi:hypothetical protein
MSANDKMIDELELSLLKYPGRVNHTWCFLHTMNLIAKSLLRIFDTDKKKQSLTTGLEVDEWAMAEETEGHDAKKGADDIEGLVDLVAEMDPMEHMVHEEHIQPVRLVLVKVFDDSW